MHRYYVSSSRGSSRYSCLLGRPRLAFQGVVLCALSLAAAGAGFGSIQAASGQSLQQYADAIRQILTKDGLYQRTTVTTRNDYKSVTERTYSVPKADGCKLTVVSSAHIHTEMTAQNRVSDRKWNDIFQPDFSVMDPGSVTVADPDPSQAQWQVKGYMVRIAVEVGKPPMGASTVDLKTNSAQEMPGLPTLAVYVSSREAADQLAKKFAQMATACRANPAGK